MDYSTDKLQYCRWIAFADELVCGRWINLPMYCSTVDGSLLLIDRCNVDGSLLLIDRCTVDGLRLLMDYCTTGGLCLLMN
jgi:hypothetical protein